MIAAAFLVLLRPYSIQCALFLLLLLLGTIATIVFFCCWHRRLHKGRHPIKSVFSGRSRSRGEGPGGGERLTGGAPAAGRGARGSGNPPGVSATAQLHAQLRAGELNMNKIPGGSPSPAAAQPRVQPEVQPGAAPFLFLLPFQMLS